MSDIVDQKENLVRHRAHRWSTQIIKRHPLFWGAAIVFAICCIPLLALLALDTRTLSGVNVWVKPLKFFVSISIYFATLAWVAQQLPGHVRDGKKLNIANVVFIAAAVIELAWITAAASLAIRSHYHSELVFWRAIYPVMGIIAITLTSATATYAVVAYRHLSPGPIRTGIVGGLGLTFALTMMTVGTLTGVGFEAPNPALQDVPRIPFFGWPITFLDQRVAHFLSLHAMQFGPLIALLAAGLVAPQMATRLVTIGLFAYAGFTLSVFLYTI